MKSLLGLEEEDEGDEDSQSLLGIDNESESTENKCDSLNINSTRFHSENYSSSPFISGLPPHSSPNHSNFPGNCSNGIFGAEPNELNMCRSHSVGRYAADIVYGSSEGLPTQSVAVNSDCSWLFNYPLSTNSGDNLISISPPPCDKKKELLCRYESSPEEKYEIDIEEQIEATVCTDNKNNEFYINYTPSSGNEMCNRGVGELDLSSFLSSSSINVELEENDYSSSNYIQCTNSEKEKEINKGIEKIAVSVVEKEKAKESLGKEIKNSSLEPYSPSLANVTNEAFRKMRTKNIKIVKSEVKSNGLKASICHFRLIDRKLFEVNKGIGKGYTLKVVAELNCIRVRLCKPRSLTKYNKNNNNNSNVGYGKSNDFLYDINYVDITGCFVELLKEDNHISEHNSTSKMIIYLILKRDPFMNNNNIININISNKGLSEEMNFDFNSNPFAIDRPHFSKEQLNTMPYVVRIESVTNYHANVFHFELLLSKILLFENKRRNRKVEYYSREDIQRRYKRLENITEEDYLLSSPLLRTVNDNLPFPSYRRYFEEESKCLTDEEVVDILESLFLESK